MRKPIAKLLVMAVLAQVSAIPAVASEEEFDAYRRFAFDLFSQVGQEHGQEGNVVISPVSAWYALGMLQQGAASTTLSCINQTLRLSPDFAGLSTFNQQLTQELLTPITWYDWLDFDSQQGMPALELANSYWVDDQITCLEEYHEALQAYYQAEYSQLDLQQQESLDLVDAWVSEKTHGTIPSLRLPLNESMRMLLVNALYFKAGWGECEFRADSTEDQPFTMGNGQVRQVPMMFAMSQLSYAEHEGFQAVRLGLGVDSRFTITFFIGQSDDTPLTSDVYSAVDQALSYRHIRLRLPRFKTDFEVELNDALKAMGMEEAFTLSADFSRMSTDPLCVSLVKQLTHIGVDEQGVEASAATVIENVTTGIGEPPHYIDVTFDHPFYFAIEDHLSQSLLFLGHVQDIEGETIPNANVLHSLSRPRPVSYYDVMGRRLSHPSKGLNIVIDGGHKGVPSSKCAFSL